MLKKLDDSVQAIALALHAACENHRAAQIRFSFRITPDASVWAPDYWFTAPDGSVRKDFPSRDLERQVEEAAVHHWRLTQELGQPRWYMMTVNVERSGKYSVDFEYRDDYREGDIMKELD
ncbi:MAG TPA: hypothetical protein VIN03_07950 [Roseateles sp.]